MLSILLNIAPHSVLLLTQISRMNECGAFVFHLNLFFLYDFKIVSFEYIKKTHLVNLHCKLFYENHRLSANVRKIQSEGLVWISATMSLKKKLFGFP